ncbi:thiamine phosphate synthase [Methanolobus sp. WCC5]|uniref:thiamine phosphate synthase n=1 Tax=Methanolobus sp. WCC5 TaxID=3125785 RepID=UPI0032465177
MKGFYFITDANLSLAGSRSDVRAAAKAGAKIIQYRRKEGTTASLYKEARELKSLCKDAKFIVNDRVDIALAIDADGVHVGRDDLPVKVVRYLLGPDKILGVTVRDLEEAVQAEKEGADYLGVGPVYYTSTKKDAGPPAGIQLIRNVRNVCRLPVVAIGGITLENADEVIKAGADMICAVSATVAEPDVGKAVSDFQKLFKYH